MKIVALEEHYVTAEVAAAWARLDGDHRDPMATFSSDSDLGRRLICLDEERLAVMDSAGIDVQVLSLTTPGLFDLDPADAVALQTTVNDQIAEATARHPQRLQGFATLAPQRPEVAAAELERAVRQLGFHGALVFSRVRGEPLDHQKFWPVFEAAEALRAPLYLHPQTPPVAVRQAYYSGLGNTVDVALATHGIGWHYDAGLQFLRLVLAGVFDRFPHLQVILGHWGEMLPFFLDRVDHIAPMAGLQRSISEYITTNAFLTPGGIFSQRYLNWALDVIGADRLLFAADYPYVLAADGAARAFLEEADVSTDIRQAIGSRNWDRLSEQIRR
ncbi:amidohydrolase [Mycobacterium sp. CBMA293]|uniref:amidohydrolase family protein n=1 Tax=unclassified Mycolicibacterium TaxID=2636767 RepID=UPI0012DF24F8|nr:MULTISPECIES: amidohydrolase family protein [unclassified Mycolicibacterium]MUL45414.1 amidohydrolase [Mycolicibacterium sp. CBMA 360]MUL56935.1 amidohydrolase [Mycolicibacterium sp. CBMA 335]MUL69975.1 amidohydrolase [Mycolicibacterium sp. CBMA 311]MUL92023.1 amidohydrolase [Mycolicibacterium sp. CBMA 230]MUM05761.1 amidohydrolase [Mycolicibacterium sp. CBMA 213]